LRNFVETSFLQTDIYFTYSLLRLFF